MSARMLSPKKSCRFSFETSTTNITMTTIENDLLSNVLIHAPAAFCIPGPPGIHETASGPVAASMYNCIVLPTIVINMVAAHTIAITRKIMPITISTISCTSLTDEPSSPLKSLSPIITPPVTLVTENTHLLNHSTEFIARLPSSTLISTLTPVSIVMLSLRFPTCLHMPM